MIGGRCPKCGYHCYGWALLNPENQTCPKCGTKLVITRKRGNRETSHARQAPKFC